MKPTARLMEHRRQLLKPKRLGQIVVRTGAHRLHRRGHCCKRGHDYNASVRIERFDLAEQLQAVTARKLQTEENQAHRLLFSSVGSFKPRRTKSTGCCSLRTARASGTVPAESETNPICEAALQQVLRNCRSSSITRRRSPSDGRSQ